MALPRYVRESIQILYHPGTMLMLAFVLGALARRTHLHDVKVAMRNSLRHLPGVAVALFAMLGLSRLMVYSGMIETLATTAAQSAGASWPLFAPFVGVLGTLMTGSATASNILFTDF